MKADSVHSRSLCIASLVTLATVVLALPLTAQVVDPDPELFDGTRTKKEKIEEQQQQPVVDDWEGPNLIVYDSDEEGSASGGMGRAGYSNPGMEIGSGSGMGLNLPIPPVMGGGGMGAGADLSIPETPQGMGAGMDISSESEQGGGSMAAGAGMSAEAMQGMQGMNAPKTAAAVGAAQKPGEVKIGDGSQKIASAPAPLGDTSGLEKTSESQTSDGGDTTEMKAASGAQSGVRGAGVEKGDAIPTDL